MKPNIVIINPDQLRWDYLSCYGHKFIETKNIDRLAKMGTLFEHTFASAPMCGPSRVSFLTGQYPIEHGVRQYGGQYDQSKPSALKILGDAGYKRAIWGKDHCFKGNVIGSLYDEGEDICIGIMGQNPNYVNAWDSAELEKDSQWNLTKRLTDSGIDFIKQNANSDQPFFLTLNYQDPHPFFTCPEPYCSLFDSSQFNLPANYRNAPIEKEIRRLTHWRIHSGETDMPSEELKQAMAMYCGQIRYVDDQVGNILDTLKNLELLDNTIIVFWSDHGEFIGDFGVTHKIPAFYECLMRVPLIIYDPTGRLPKGKNTSLVELMDGMATVLDLCNLEQPQGSHAISQVSGKNTRKDIYADAGMMLQQPKEPVANFRIKGAMPPTPYGPGSMLRNEEWKICLYADDQGELYNILQDPNEKENLFDVPQYQDIKTTMMNRLIQRMMCFGQMPERLPRGDY
ncbi:sulfatase-like hydrolase/transferase [Alteromonas sp. 1_MG-2023]|uniref:sulfatase family protein n=1 Tax=Alteromonas sp. 1_MG-2023 TaxID=3062669 RepID=UPI0026E19727|nr:sulfatase-like hydrolase/transferase [Alteromonas sp. 1_MG-2023]MDO6567904.1 sulfatase-like hydrolase/transferase [Alteromonas sp. 1_MG-2023]